MDIQSLARAYPAVLWRFRTQGQPVAPRGELTREIIDFHLHVRSGLHVLPVRAGRGVSTSLANELALQVLAGVYRPDRLQLLGPHVDDDKLEGYGPLLEPGIQRSIEYLRADPDTRRAVANLGHTGEDSGYPCTVSLGWLLRRGHLHAFSEMRSNDAWLGLPYDLYVFAAVQRSIAAVLGVSPGPLHHHVRSFHIYERDIAKIDQVRPAEKLWPTLTVRGRTWDDVQGEARARLGL